MDSKQREQELEYAFPYHHIPSLENGSFSQVRNFFWGYEYLSYLERIVLALERLEWGTLLDVGCGEGKLLYEIQKRFQYKKLTGLDYSARAVAFARAFVPDAEYIVRDIIREPETDKRFDVVTLIETLEHIPPADIPAFIKALRQLIKPGGTLIVTVPSANVPVLTKHYQHFTKETLEHTLSPAFTIESTQYLNLLSSRTNLIKRLLGNRLVLLNFPPLVNALHTYYRRYLVVATPQTCKRLMVICRSL